MVTVMPMILYQTRPTDLPKHVADSWPRHSSLWVHIVQMVLYKLNRSGEVSLIELVRYVPTEGSEFPSLLHHGVQKCNSVQ